MIRIAVDAMGGDHAPRTVVEGALLALEKYDDLHVVLAGPAEGVQAEIDRVGGVDPSRYTVAEAPEVVEMHESPVEALRKKRHSSIRIATGLVREGKCDGMFSAGNTGAVVAASSMLLGLLPGVRRAGIAVALPVREDPVVLMDVGANVQCRAIHLVQYGVMASEFMSCMFGTQNPTVGLLNVGEEDQKGNRLTKETHDLFRGTSMAYLGNVEGGDIFHSQCNVVVCDGFVGNIVLKTTEGLWERLGHLLSDEVRALGEQGALLQKVLYNLAARFDYQNSGGAPLLGPKGAVVIGHGRSDAQAVASGLRWTREMVVKKVNEAIVRRLEGEHVTQESES